METRRANRLSSTFKAFILKRFLCSRRLKLLIYALGIPAKKRLKPDSYPPVIQFPKISESRSSLKSIHGDSQQRTK